MIRAKRLLGLDLGLSSVKAVELTRDGDVLSVTAAAQAPVSSPTELTGTIRETLRRGGFHTKLTCLNVSGRLVSVKYITLPAMSDQDLKKALPFEADKHIPFEVGDACLDGQRIGEPEEGAKEITAVLAAAKRNLVLERAQLVSFCGLAPAIVDVDVFAAGNAFEVSAMAGGPVDAARSVAVVDLGASKTSVNILKGTATCFTREIYVGGNDVTEAIAKRLSLSPSDAEAAKCAPGDREAACRQATAMTLEDLANEVRMSLEFYENQFESSVSEVLLCGGAARLPWLAETFQTILGKPTSVWNPFKNLPAGPGVDAASLGGGYAVALGLASRLRSL